MEHSIVDNWRALLVRKDCTIKDALSLFEKNHAPIVFITTPEDHLLGSVTDGDIRRGLLKNIQLSASVESIMNTAPFTARESMPGHEVASNMKALDIRFTPLVSERGMILGIYGRPGIHIVQNHNNTVVIMAGGEGKRLRPLTEKLPKPMVLFNGKPILERIITDLAQKGFQDLYISINYLGHVIEDYFEDGKKWNVNITYLREDQKLGTAGALQLLDRRDRSILVMNGDLITSLDFASLLEQHDAQKAQATICVQKAEFKIPYGVVRMDHMDVLSLQEKPTLDYHVNCGVYAVSPNALEFLKGGESIDMTSFIDRLLKSKQKVSAFPIYENWYDIANTGDLEQVQKIYAD